MKQKKRLLTLVLALVLCFTLSTTSFAADTNNMPEVKKETVTFSLDAGESTMAVQPRIWNQTSMTVQPNSHTTGLKFYIPDRYFAYEVYVTNSNGSTSNSNFALSLMYDVTSTVTSISGIANGTTYKNDHIDLTSGGRYYNFRFINNSNNTLTFYVTYYSWA